MPAFMSWACFDCRKSFKCNSICPDCGKDLNCMGNAFKAPRKNNLKQWKKVKLLFENGIRFYKDSYITMPKTYAQAKVFVKEKREREKKNRILFARYRAQ